jgi:elongation factor G
MVERSPAGPRCAALVGPYLSGKTSLLEALLFATGAIPRKGNVKEGTTVGDASAEARDRKMTVEVSFADTTYLDEAWSFIDCPGSIEFFQETANALPVVDAAIVVCESTPERAIALAPIFKALDDNGVPHIVFVNKVDHSELDLPALMEAMQSVSERPLVLRELPIKAGDKVTGYVDLVSERAYKYQPGKASELIKIPDAIKGDEGAARTTMLERLADFDDALLEKLLEDAVPPPPEIYAQCAKDFAEDKIVPVFLGAAEQDHGIRRLLKALRHETPGVAAVAARRGLKGDGEAAIQVFKTSYGVRSGKLSYARVLRGEIAEGATVNGARVGGLLSLVGATQNKLAKASAGKVVALARMDTIKTGALLTPSGNAPAGVAPWPKPMTPVYSMAIHAENRNDEVKLTGALHSLVDEDPALSYQQNDRTHELLLHGQGEIHLQVALARLKSKYNVPVKAVKPSVPYEETIKRGIQQHGRFKRQTGGHGQFGDVHLDIKPLPRGKGFAFEDKVVGGAVPRQFIPAVEAGAREFLVKGILVFPVVYISVTLTDGQYHAVDSSEMAFKQAARVTLTEALPKCDPVLLEPINKVEIDVPSEYTSKANALISSRRGQILGFSPKDGWKGWDTVQAHMPASEIHDLIIELRSLTQGAGTYRTSFDHMQELTGRLADDVLASKKETAEAAH